MQYFSESQRQPVATFDDLGIQQKTNSSEGEVENVAFQILQLKSLLSSAFQLEGFCRAAATNGIDMLVVEYINQERNYLSFQEGERCQLL